ncbi:LysR family transcriptional regulator [Serratia sp. M24T3]|uniref:LysR family transcriptional regulator n=1 Tax=Rouxiella sp. WC2420 TaxID=3234145 RepID=A0AB39VQV3_9GAMM|nr:LysR family transcriptional regulator [Serratia sp. M24T3]EIC86588.1 LysR family transcriptional regulator [Serratia sp. M24T3]
MDQIQAMRIFTRITELGSFTRAAEDLDLPRATVSTTLKMLEQRLGVRLFLRTTRQVKITEEGEQYYQRCLQLLAAFDEAHNLFAHHQAQPEGHVRIDMPHSAAREIVLPALQEFSARYPLISLTVSANDNAVDLLHQGVDCVIRAWPAENENLQSRPIAMLEQITCASRDYLQRYGVPVNIADLKQHRAVAYFFAHQRPESHLEFVINKKVQQVMMDHTLTVSGADAYIAAAKSGFGLIQTSRRVVAGDISRGELIEVLPGFTPPPMPLYIMYPPGRFLAPRVRVLLDWLIELFSRL